MNMIDVTKNVKTVEMLKAQMVIECGELMRSMALGVGGDLPAQNIAGVIISSYLLMMRLGVSPAQMDSLVAESVLRNLSEDSELKPQLEELSRHFQTKNLK